MRWCPAVFIVVAALAGAAPAHADVVKLADDSWEVEDSLAGVRPAEGETVRWLTVRRIGPDSPEGLRPLSGFRDLRVLELEVVSGVDLTPLAGLRLDHLSLRYVRDVDLAPLGSLRGLKALTALNLRDVIVPPALTLPASLRSVSFANNGFRETGAPVQALVEAVDWPALSRLRDLDLEVADEPIRVDLGFLRALPRLTALSLIHGIHYRGRIRAPGLRSIEIDAWRPHRVERALRRRYPRALVTVYPRERFRPSQRDFTPFRLGHRWVVYGSLWEAFDGRFGATEYEALQAARRLIRREAPGLLRRLDFDHEADGTGIEARRRRDLGRALQILGIR